MVLQVFTLTLLNKITVTNITQCHVQFCHFCAIKCTCSIFHLKIVFIVSCKVPIFRYVSKHTVNTVMLLERHEKDFLQVADFLFLTKQRDKKRSGSYKSVFYLMSTKVLLQSPWIKCSVNQLYNTVRNTWKKFTVSGRYSFSNC